MAAPSLSIYLQIEQVQTSVFEALVGVKCVRSQSASVVSGANIVRLGGDLKGNDLCARKHYALGYYDH